MSLIVIVSGCISLGGEPVYHKDGIAIIGYDPVAYFIEGKAVKGNENINYLHRGTTWYFSSEINRRLFSENEHHYLPQYGGYCAYAMSKGFVVSSDPEAFTVYNNKLYLNYSFSVRGSWSKDIHRNVEKADTHWQHLITANNQPRVKNQSTGVARP
ncbi:MAG: YHS domain-containing protein [Pseudohongiellaceae bacterium]